jgi:aspartyl-tRNA synthetase
MNENIHGMHRTHMCGTIDKSHAGTEVTVMGWIQKQRDKGALVFADLRDRTGIVQLTFDSSTPQEDFKKAAGLRAEYVVAATGTVRLREAPNPELATGEVEIAVTALRLLSAAATPPFHIVADSDVKEELRLKYRYLDLRRPDLQSNILARHKITKIARDYFDTQGFIDIETPVLIKPTPEGARDYLVPSRVHNGRFYALPQSPQLYKQLLMLSGFDRYFQIARCFRDEDLRADRQPEFTQIDLELSFVEQEDILRVTEGFLRVLFDKFLGVTLPESFPRMTYKEAMERYGSDKPDTRFALELCDLSETVKDTSFKVFVDALAAGGAVRAINVPGGADKMSRKELDSLTDLVKTYRAKGLAWYKNGAEPSSSYGKFLTSEENAAVLSKAGCGQGDLLLIVADAKQHVVFDALGALRGELAKRLGLIQKNMYNLLWVTQFPLLEYDEESGRYFAKHHPFTAPMAEDLDKLDSAPGEVRAIAYDVVMNGWEMGGGSMRINDPALQSRMFGVLGMSEQSAQEKFGFLLEAYKYGAPPHGGLALGLDRLVSLLLGLDAIRDVIAFPKVQNASELMTGSPSVTDSAALGELGIAVVKE